MDDVTKSVSRLLGAWAQRLFWDGDTGVVHVISDEDPDFPHEGDCDATDCYDCGCCAHCTAQCPCPGCGNPDCLCSIRKDK